MVFIGIVLIIAGVIGLFLGAQGYGDIGLSFMYSAVVSILAGIGFLAANSKIKKMSAK